MRDVMAGIRKNYPRLSLTLPNPSGMAANGGAVGGGEAKVVEPMAALKSLVDGFEFDTRHGFAVWADADFFAHVDFSSYFSLLSRFTTYWT